MNEEEMRQVLRGLEACIRFMQREMAFKIAKLVEQRLQDLSLQTKIVDESDEEFIRLVIIANDGDHEHRISIDEEDDFWPWYMGRESK
ncbi:MAG: hypothetical protein ACP6IP_10480 [Candidatus Njordarchaeia archaeon]